MDAFSAALSKVAGACKQSSDTAVEAARTAVNTIEAPTILSQTVSKGQGVIEENLKPIEEKRKEVIKKAEELSKEVETKTNFIRVGIDNFNIIRRRYPDFVIYGSGLLMAIPAIFSTLSRILNTHTLK